MRLTNEAEVGDVVCFPAKENGRDVIYHGTVSFRGVETIHIKTDELFGATKIIRLSNLKL